MFEFELEKNRSIFGLICCRRSKTNNVCCEFSFYEANKPTKATLQIRFSHRKSRPHLEQIHRWNVQFYRCLMVNICLHNPANWLFDTATSYQKRYITTQLIYHTNSPLFLLSSK